MSTDKSLSSQLLRSPEFLAGARVTVLYIAWFTILIHIQLYAKISAMQQHKKSKKQAADSHDEATKTTKKKFNRYTSDNELLIISDRIVGNYLEWLVPFLCNLWLSLLTTGKGEKLGYAYIGFRILYVFIAFKGGIKLSGAQPIIFMATVPMYCILGILTSNVMGVLFF